jgi:hypothetical protein
MRECSGMLIERERCSGTVLIKNVVGEHAVRGIGISSLQVEEFTCNSNSGVTTRNPKRILPSSSFEGRQVVLGRTGTQTRVVGPALSLRSSEEHCPCLYPVAKERLVPALNDEAVTVDEGAESKHNDQQ